MMAHKLRILVVKVCCSVTDAPAVRPYHPWLKIICVKKPLHALCLSDLVVNSLCPRQFG
jgi:hypothetical protein